MRAFYVSVSDNFLQSAPYPVSLKFSICGDDEFYVKITNCLVGGARLARNVPIHKLLLIITIYFVSVTFTKLLFILLRGKRETLFQIQYHVLLKMS